jgi:peptide/nickel transport system substrate-binding protein
MLEAVHEASRESPARRAYGAWLVLLVWMAACSRAKPAPAAQRESKLSAAPAAQDDWTAGRLPASVMSGTPRPGGELRIGVDIEPSSLNTITSSDWLAKQIVLHRVYQALVRVDPYDDPNYRILPELAERWEISPDGLTYTFHLRQGVKWHDGLPFTAADVIATLDKVQDPGVIAASTRADFAELASYAAPDAHTIVLRWKRPYFLVLDALADLTIQPAHIVRGLRPAQYNEAVTNSLQRHPVGTGPFVFERWESHSQIVLHKNPDYWGRPAYLDKLQFRIVPDATVRMQLAERGELDLLYRVKFEQWVHMDSPIFRQHWQRSRFYAAKYTWIGWNMARPLFADARVRRAMTLLIDRPGIIDKLMYGLPRPTTCHFYWASAACDPALKPLPYDPAAAMALLDQAGFRDHDGDGVRDRDGQPFRFVLSLPVGSVDLARNAAKIKEDMARAGVEMELEKVEWSALLSRANAHEFDAIALLWGGDARMDPTQIWHSSSIDGGSNFISFRNAEADRLIERARVTLEPGARNALFRKLGAILQAEQPYTFLYVPPELDLLHDRVHGARPSLYWWQFEDLWLEPASRKD